MQTEGGGKGFTSHFCAASSFICLNDELDPLQLLRSCIQIAEGDGEDESSRKRVVCDEGGFCFSLCIYRRVAPPPARLMKAVSCRRFAVRCVSNSLDSFQTDISRVLILNSIGTKGCRGEERAGEPHHYKTRRRFSTAWKLVIGELSDLSSPFSSTPSAFVTLRNSSLYVQLARPGFIERAD